MIESLWRQRWLRYGVLAIFVISLVLLSHLQISGLPLGGQAAWAQATAASFSRRLQQGTLSAAVYERLPDLPLENHYVRSDTGLADPSNTLVNRVVRYHLYVKGRVTQYRLDWKLTMADYLGANERMDDDRYPLASRLRTNPMAGDQHAIATLNRQERDQLVQVLIEVCHPELVGTLDNPGGTSPAANPGASNDSTIPSAPVTGAGAADLLR